jgi:hypothetical protein
VRKDVNNTVKLMAFPNSASSTDRYVMQFDRDQLERLIATRFNNSYVSFLEAIRLN